MRLGEKRGPRGNLPLRQSLSDCLDQQRRTHIVSSPGDVVHHISEGDAVLRVGEAEGAASPRVAESARALMGLVSVGSM